MTSQSSQDKVSAPSAVYSYGQHHMNRRAATHTDFFQPHIRPNMTLVDCGCSAGTITVDLAEIVAPGPVLGIDINGDALAKARNLAIERGIRNVRFEEASIYEIPCADASVDAVLIHTVLHHLAEPEAALREARRVLKPGGVIGVRDPDFAARIVGPTGASNEVYELWATMIERNGGNPYIGRDLRRLLHESDFCDVIATASYETHGTPESIASISDTIVRALMPDGALGAGMLRLGLVSQERLADLRASTIAWADQPGAFLARNWCEAVGWKT